ncbi:enoyl-CoA hydratase/isomerase family protein [Rhodococcus sp. T7]|uniref:enoyl-CoA hydratase/isomerase family protein n=1 Tax=Rhodococcus sp. T7 TaxID=627444 RepID=UPI00135AE3AF|nr:enoyl-CoA hydratase-related protein [Rhodococcus sp. T7]KAF0957549.1 Enoyl-CoA-hydratase [Rhodococcus sp. T7]KAF0964459.1 Enoyl-CoA-hydratase [Rhodococcus sp. T7]
MNSSDVGSEPILVDRSDGICVVTLNRPSVGNAITAAMFQRLREVFDEIEADDNIRVAVLTGAGADVFCAGGDLRELIPTLTTGDLSAVIPDPSKRILSEVYTPIIAAVNGACIAGGMELLLGTDVRIAAEHATFRTPEATLGLVGAQGTVTRLAHQIPWAIAMELLLMGSPIDAHRAAQAGLVNRVVPAADLQVEALRVAERICASGPLAVRATKEIVMKAAAMERPFMIEAELAARVFASEDAAEGPRSFVERRTPRFMGR